jgi:hypothetical protein
MMPGERGQMRHVNNVLGLARTPPMAKEPNADAVIT